MKTRTMLMIALGLTVAGTACKKKKAEEVKTDPGGMKPTDGSAMKPTDGSAAMTPPPKATPKSGKDLADAYLACSAHLSAGKMDDFKKDCIAADFKGHNADAPDTTADTHVEQLKGYWAAFPDMKASPQVVMVNGRNVLGVELLTGTHTGPLKMPGMPAEIPATNKKIGALLFHRITFNDENKAMEEWSYFDPTTMMGQLGLLPKEAPPARAAMEKGLDGAPMIIVAADDAKEKANLEALKKSTAAFNSKKAADFMAFYTDDAVESDQAGSKDHKGKKEIQESAEGFIKAFPDVKITEVASFTAGDYAVMQGTFEGTNTGPLGPMKPTGKAVKGDFAEVVEFKDGKVAKLWRFRNGMAMAMQLGLMGDKGAPPKATEPVKGAEPKGSATGSAAGSATK